MSLSSQAREKGQGKPLTGRVIIGLGAQGPGETTVAEIERRRAGASAGPGWSPKTEEEYLRRVRERATVMAKDILEKALTEAEAAREQAVKEGFDQGMSQAQEQVQTMLTEQADTLAGMLGTLQNAGPALWEKHRQDMVDVVRLAVEKVVRLEMGERRAQVMGGLLDQALEAIDNLRQLSVRVHPGDAEGMELLLEQAKARHPGLERWRVKADQNLAPGALVVESDQGMVDNSMEVRHKAIADDPGPAGSGQRGRRMSLTPRGCLSMLKDMDPCQTFGKVSKVVGLIAEGRGIKAPLGSVCRLLPDAGASRRHPRRGGGLPRRLLPVHALRRDARHPPGLADQEPGHPAAFPRGQPLFGPGRGRLRRRPGQWGRHPTAPVLPAVRQTAQPPGAPAHLRPPGRRACRAINGLLTLGKGQRVGIMAGSGVGKSTLMGMMARYTKADVNVIALVGERGREVVEFMEKDLGPEGMSRSVLVVATSDHSPLVRMRAAYAATAMAEFFRDQGKDVLLMMDSVTRFAMAAREVGLAAGRAAHHPGLHALGLRAAAQAPGARGEKPKGHHHRHLHRARGRRRLQRTHRRRRALHPGRAHRAHPRTGRPGPLPVHRRAEVHFPAAH